MHRKHPVRLILEQILLKHVMKFSVKNFGVQFAKHLEALKNPQEIVFQILSTVKKKRQVWIKLRKFIVIRNGNVQGPLPSHLKISKNFPLSLENLQKKLSLNLKKEFRKISFYEPSVVFENVFKMLLECNYQISLSRKYVFLMLLTLIGYFHVEVTC